MPSEPTQSSKNASAPNQELGRSEGPRRVTLTLGMMAKYWTAGQVKTRLGASIGMASAADLHRLFVTHLGESLQNAADRRFVVLTPADRQAEFADRLPPSWETTLQGDGDLGERMSRWFRQSLTTGSDHAILIGADCPTLRPDDIDRAADGLSTHNVVLGPAADGGYYLIGLQGRWNDRLDSLFQEMTWSSDRVYRATCDRAAMAGLSVANLEVREDIDTINELDRLRSQLADSAHDDTRVKDLARAIERILTDHGDPLSEGPPQ